MEHAKHAKFKHDQTQTGLNVSKMTALRSSSSLAMEDVKNAICSQDQQQIKLSARKTSVLSIRS